MVLNGSKLHQKMGFAHKIVLLDVKMSYFKKNIEKSYIKYYTYWVIASRSHTNIMLYSCISPK